MYVWLLAGVALGILVSDLVRRIPESSLAEMSYITVLAVFNEWKRKRKPTKGPSTEASPERRGLRAAVGRISLF